MAAEAEQSDHDSSGHNSPTKPRDSDYTVGEVGGGGVDGDTSPGDIRPRALNERQQEIVDAVVTTQKHVRGTIARRKTLLKKAVIRAEVDTCTVATQPGSVVQARIT